MPGTRKLGKTTAQRKAMLRQQVTDFLDKGRMETTITRAKEIKPLAEKMITLGKQKGLLHTARHLSSSPVKMLPRRCLMKSLRSMQSATAAIPASPASAHAAAMQQRPQSSNWSEPNNRENTPGSLQNDPGVFFIDFRLKRHFIEKRRET